MFLLEIVALNKVVPVPVNVIFPVPILQVEVMLQLWLMFMAQFVFVEGQVQDVASV